jgi:hypothetical protein
MNQVAERQEQIRYTISVLLRELARLGPPDLALLRKVRRAQQSQRPRATAEELDAIRTALDLGGDSR